MMKLFKQIRHGLIDKTGKPALPTGRYLKYALGEIFLVVIGIWIALQINNWNEYRKERIVERTILTNIKDALISDLENTFKSQLNNTRETLLATETILPAFENKQIVKDSIKYAYLISVRNFNPMTIPYKFLESKGFDVIQNEQLKFAISKIYDLEYSNIVYMLNNYHENINSYARPYVRENFQFRRYGLPLSERYIPFDHSKLFQDPQFLNIATTLNTNNRILLNFLLDTATEVKKLITMIEEELEK